MSWNPRRFARLTATVPDASAAHRVWLNGPEAAAALTAAGTADDRDPAPPDGLWIGMSGLLDAGSHKISALYLQSMTSLAVSTLKVLARSQGIPAGHVPATPPAEIIDVVTRHGTTCLAGFSRNATTAVVSAEVTLKTWELRSPDDKTAVEAEVAAFLAAEGARIPSGWGEATDAARCLVSGVLRALQHPSTIPGVAVRTEELETTGRKGGPTLPIVIMEPA